MGHVAAVPACWVNTPQRSDAKNSADFILLVYSKALLKGLLTEQSLLCALLLPLWQEPSAKGDGTAATPAEVSDQEGSPARIPEERREEEGNNGGGGGGENRGGGNENGGGGNENGGEGNGDGGEGNEDGGGDQPGDDDDDGQGEEENEEENKEDETEENEEENQDQTEENQDQDHEKEKDKDLPATPERVLSLEEKKQLERGQSKKRIEDEIQKRKVMEEQAKRREELLRDIGKRQVACWGTKNKCKRQRSKKNPCLTRRKD